MLYSSLDIHLDFVGSAAGVKIEKQVVEVVIYNIRLGGDSEDDSNDDSNVSKDNEDSVSMVTRKRRALTVFKQTFADDDLMNVVGYYCRISIAKAVDLTSRFESYCVTFSLASRSILETQFETKIDEL